MASGMQNQERVPANLKKKLALAVRSIQWSYAIFWSISATQSGVLEWGDGYYNGDIKTRKTIQSMEVNADKMDLQRSEQLRELYESLSSGEASPQTRRPSAALAPEDLTDTEWYYLVCMSFVFDIGRGLPGKTLAKGEPIWLCNAHYADSKAFSRSLLAKSASIQTVVCFPFLGGVVELGVTDLILEDPGIIQHIKTSYLEFPYPIVSTTRNDKALAYAAADHNIFDTKLVPLGYEELGITSPSNSSNGCQSKQFEELNEQAFQVQSWQFMDEEFNNCVHDSMTSSDCISQTFVDPKCEKPDLQECNNVKLSLLNLKNNDVHYQSVLSTLLSSNQSLLASHIQNSNKESSFVSWKKGCLMNCQSPRDGNPQRVLKKVLFTIPRMHVGGLLESPEDNDLALSETYFVLKSIVPSANKLDNVSILDNTIEYLKQLERRVQELECKARTNNKVERTSDNSGNEIIGKKVLINKRKASDFDDEPGQEVYHVVNRDGSINNLIVSIKDKDVLIEIRCPWREGLLLEIMDTMSSLHLYSHSVQSSTNDGILSLTIKAKFKGSSVSPSEWTIRRAIQRITKC